MNTIALTQVLGIIFAAMGLSVLVNKKSMVALVEESFANKGFLWIIGLFTLIMGVVIVAMNNLWTSGLQLVVTIIGWVAVIKGLFIMLLPETSVWFYRRMGKSGVITIGGVIALILGLILIYKGFM